MSESEKSRFPDGYMKFLTDHQYQALANNEAEKKATQNQVKKEAKPSRALYVAPGVRTTTADMNANTKSIPTSVSNPSSPNVLTFSSETEKEISICLDQVDLMSYMADARPLIQQAIDQPDRLMPRVLEEVGGFIVNRAWEDTTYHDTAADLCVFICVKERYSQRNFLPLYAFLRGLMIHTQELVDKWDEMRAAKQDYWTAYIKFMIRLFRRLSERDFGVIMLGGVVVKIAEALLTPLCLPNVVERGLLVTLFVTCARHIENAKTDLLTPIINRVRDLILDPHPDVKVRENLIQVVEVYAKTMSSNRASGTR